MPQRNVSWIYQSPKSSTTSSSAAAQNFQSVTTPPERLFKLKMLNRLLKMDSRPLLPNDGGPLRAWEES